MFLLKECLALPFSMTSFKEIHIFDLDGSITNNWQHLFPVKLLAQISLVAAAQSI